MSKVFITDYISDPNIELSILGKDLASTDINEIDPNKVEVLLVWHQKIDKTYIKTFPNLKAVIRYGVGFDNLDLNFLNSKGIVACNTPDYGVDEVSDSALAMTLYTLRGIGQYQALARQNTQSWQNHTLSYIRRFSNLTIGVLGAGRIGGRYLIKAKALGFQTVFYDPFKPAGHEKTLGADRVDSLDKLLKRSDVISIHTPLTKDTLGMVDQAFIQSMKKQGILINTARGKIISDLDIFYEPLKNNRLLAVCQDVLPEEPPEKGKLIEAWHLNEPWLEGRLIINPHVAYFSQSSFIEMREKTARNALRALRAQPLLNQI